MTCGVGVFSTVGGMIRMTSEKTEETCTRKNVLISSENLLTMRRKFIIILFVKERENRRNERRS